MKPNHTANSNSTARGSISHVRRWTFDVRRSAFDVHGPVPHAPSSFLTLLLPLLLLLLSTADRAYGATTRYVWQSSPSPAPPYTTWDTAATTIQAAVDAAVAGDEIVVTNGTYATGMRAVFRSMYNRVAVTKPLTVRSVNGPQVTVIQGYQVPGTTNGSSAVRCVYLTNGASLCGFTLTNGATHRDTGYGQEDQGGGAWCESGSAVLTNCVLAGNSAAQGGGGAYRGTLIDCVFQRNSALGDSYGGGSGGGAFGADLSYCTLTNNKAAGGGGAAAGGTLTHCILGGNSAVYGGGGASGGLLTNCTLTGNSALGDLRGSTGNGGGVYQGTLHNCTLTGNSAGGDGGGVYQGTLNNCTLTGNLAGGAGGGVRASALTNCIVYFNTAAVGANYFMGTFVYCCTTPLPAGSVASIAVDPQLADASHLSATSPCRGAGSAGYATGVDIDGESWANPPSIGCDEYHPRSITGSLTVSYATAHTNVAVGFPVSFTASIAGRASASVWDFGDGVAISNRPYATHAWTAPGDYVVVLRAYNESYPFGVSTTTVIRVVARPVHYVAADSLNPLPPYDSWATAARNIQDAVDAAVLPGALVLVADGTYATGGRAVYGSLLNRVAVTKPVTVQSVNGPEVTIIQGYQVPGTTNGNGAIRCAYLTNGASLFGFTLTSGATQTIADTANSRLHNGGGVWCESGTVVISNCVIAGNSARWRGGGAHSGTLKNCILTGNSAWHGGGAHQSTLNDCTASSNSTDVWSGVGGGVCECELNRCLLVDNSAGMGGGAYWSMLDHCTLGGNSAASGGGAAWGVLSHCTLTNNSTWATDAGEGGGAYVGTLYNCVLSRNTAATRGGGGSQCRLYNCTITGNSAQTGGGVYLAGTETPLCNCIVYHNTGSSGANYAFDPQPGSGVSTVDHCCTTPLPTNGAGNITRPPSFVNQAAGDLHLQPDSPCINAGRNAYALFSTDLDGNPRIVSGTVDIGAYEYQGPGSTISYAWLQQYGLPTDGSADYLDTDGDSHNTWQEWRCWTDPNNAASVLRLLSASPAGGHVSVRWQSVPGVSYSLERSADLASTSPFAVVATALVGQPGTTTYADTNAAAAPWHFYRVGVSE